MTSRTTPGHVGPSVDTHDMVVIHRAFRRESRLLVSLIAAVPDGDMRRARQLAGHLRWYRLGLHNLHQGEDELIWPLLRARVNLEADVVLPATATLTASGPGPKGRGPGKTPPAGPRPPGPPPPGPLPPGHRAAVAASAARATCSG